MFEYTESEEYETSRPFFTYLNNPPVITEENARLFKASTKSGNFKVEEMNEFEQSDILKDEMYFMDTNQEIFCVKNENSSETEKQLTKKAVDDYANFVSKLRKSEIPIVEFSTTGIPPLNFRRKFYAYTIRESAIDPRERSLLKYQEQMRRERIEEAERKLEQENMAQEESTTKDDDEVQLTSNDPPTTNEIIEVKTVTNNHQKVGEMEEYVRRVSQDFNMSEDEAISFWNRYMPPIERSSPSKMSSSALISEDLQETKEKEKSSIPIENVLDDKSNDLNLKSEGVTKILDEASLTSESTQIQTQIQHESTNTKLELDKLLTLLQTLQETVSPQLQAEPLTERIVQENQITNLIETKKLKENEEMKIRTSQDSSSNISMPRSSSTGNFLELQMKSFLQKAVGEYGMESKQAKKMWNELIFPMLIQSSNEDATK